MNKAFTLIEVLLVIGLLATFTTILPVGLDFYKNQELNTHTRQIINVLRLAQQKAMSVELDSNFGVYLTNNEYILFKGNSYETRDSQYDEKFDLPQIITVNGISEVVFLKSEGPPKESPANCGGDCLSCSEFKNRRQCRRQAGCSWNFFQRICTGVCTSCDNFSDQSGCENQSGCIWYPAVQGGDIVLSNGSEAKTININEIGRITQK